MNVFFTQNILFESFIDMCFIFDVHHVKEVTKNSANSGKEMAINTNKKTKRNNTYKIYSCIANADNSSKYD